VTEVIKVTSYQLRHFGKEASTILVLAVVLFAAGAIAMIRTTTFVQSSHALVAMSDADLASQADLVVLATVGGQTSRAVTTPGSHTLTTTTLNVERTLKGAPRATVQVTTRGGDAGTVIERDEDEAQFAPGRVLVFLYADPTNGPMVLGGIQGLYRVAGDMARSEAREVPLNQLLASIAARR